MGQEGRSLTWSGGGAEGVEPRVWSRECGAEGVDLSSHNTNPPGVFDGEAIALSDMAEIRLEEAIASLGEFVDDHGRLPTANSWTEARMRPSEKTIRRRFGSFQKAVAIAGLGTE